MTTSSHLRSLADATCMVRMVDTVPRGHVRLETKFKYPDGASIDLFIVNRPQPDLLASVETLSDLGQTTMWLRDMQLRLNQTKRRRELVEDALEMLEVSQRDAALETAFEPTPRALEDAVIRLGQACSRVADLSFMKRYSLQAPVSEELEDVIIDTDLPYEANALLAGRHGNDVRVDFLVQGKRRRSAVLAMRAQSNSLATNQANSLLARAFDLFTPDREEQVVAVYDDSFPVYQNTDLDRLADLCLLFPLSRRHDIAATIAA